MNTWPRDRRDCHLRPAGAGLTLRTPERALDLPLLHPPALPSPVPHQADASSWWPGFPWRELAAAPARLWLDAALPEAWHRFPFEALWEGGRPLHESLEVVRLAGRHHAPARPPRDWRTLVLDRWPDSRFADALMPLVERQRLEIWRGPYVDRRLAGQPDLSGHDLLLVIAHGGEGEVLLTDEAGRPWSPRLPDGLPHTVWLATCTDHLDELHAFARAALARGARRVLASEGAVAADAALGRILALLGAQDAAGEPPLPGLRLYGSALAPAAVIAEDPGSRAMVKATRNDSLARCPVCHNAYQDARFVVLSAGALRRTGPRSAVLDPDLAGFMYLDVHDHRAPAAGHVVIAEDAPAGQTEIHTCSTACLRRLLNAWVDRLEARNAEDDSAGTAGR